MERSIWRERGRAAAVHATRKTPSESLVAGTPAASGRWSAFVAVRLWVMPIRVAGITDAAANPTPRWTGVRAGSTGGYPSGVRFAAGHAAECLGSARYAAVKAGRVEGSSGRVGCAADLEQEADQSPGHGCHAGSQPKRKQDSRGNTHDANDFLPTVPVAPAAHSKRLQPLNPPPSPTLPRVDRSSDKHFALRGQFENS